MSAVLVLVQPKICAINSLIYFWGCNKLCSFIIRTPASKICKSRDVQKSTVQLFDLMQWKNNTYSRSSLILTDNSKTNMHKQMALKTQTFYF